MGIRRWVDEGNRVLDLIFTLVLLGMFALGAWRAAVVSGSGLFALVCGYAGGILAANRGGPWVADSLVVSPLAAPAIAGPIGFVVAWLVVSSIRDVAVAWDRGRTELGVRGPFDRGLGGFSAWRAADGSSSCWRYSPVGSAARDIGALSELAAMPDAENSRIADAAGGLVESAVSSALAGAGPAGEVAARLTARPGQALGSVQAILEDERLTGLFEDRLFWTLISNNSVDYAMNRTSIRSIKVTVSLQLKTDNTCQHSSSVWSFRPHALFLRLRSTTVMSTMQSK